MCRCIKLPLHCGWNPPLMNGDSFLNIIYLINKPLSFTKLLSASVFTIIMLLNMYVKSEMSQTQKSFRYRQINALWFCSFNQPQLHTCDHSFLRIYCKHSFFSTPHTFFRSLSGCHSIKFLIFLFLDIVFDVQRGESHMQDISSSICKFKYRGVRRGVSCVLSYMFVGMFEGKKQAHKWFGQC